MTLNRKESPSASDPSQDANIFVGVYGPILDEQPSIIVDEKRDYLADDFMKELNLDNPPFRKIEKKYGKSIAEKIRENRARILILLDTPGGNALYGNKIVSATNKILESHTFVPREAGSMGSIIFNSGENRHTVEDAKIWYHMGAYKVPFLPIMVMINRHKIDLHTDFLIQNVSPEYRGMVESRLESARKDRKNHDELISFTGSELHQIGISHNSYPTIIEMRDEVQRISGIQHEGVSKFFAISQMEKMYKEYQENMDPLMDHAVLKIGATWEEIKKK